MQCTENLIGKTDLRRIRKGKWGIAGELKEENMRNAETANIWRIQTEKREKKKEKYSSAEVEK